MGDGDNKIHVKKRLFRVWHSILYYNLLQFTSNSKIIEAVELPTYSGLKQGRWYVDYFFFLGGGERGGRPKWDSNSVSK